MDVGQYYITTITNAAQKIGPMIFYFVAGYFLFFKLPFMLYYRNLQKSKDTPDQPEFKADAHFQKKMEEERKNEFTQRMKNLGGSRQENGDSKKDPPHEKKHQKKSRPNNNGDRRSQAIKATPEEVLFKLKPGQVFNAQELKKIYHKLLQENHPDKFRTQHQKEFAEAKTKTINEAYQNLKKRVS